MQITLLLILTIFSCGLQNFETDEEDDMKYLAIEHSDEESKKIYLPREIIHMNDPEQRSVLTLLELATRATYIHHRPCK